MKVEKLDSLLSKLAVMAGEAKTKYEGSVAVGYTAAYAIFVHEDMEAQHKEGSGAKFLEGPARLFAKEIADVVAAALKAGRTMVQALFLGGLRLQRESQDVCPVDTGDLRASAFTRVEE